MREIKFRCWYDNEMFRVESIDFKRKRIVLYAADTIDFKDGILMQFTGLVDKNGKEIYEGDIVCFKGSYYVVKYFSEYGRFALSDNIVQDSLPMIIGNPVKYEVIGNIYENRGLV